MTDGTTLPLDEIRGLVAERTRFETWLSTLEARRSATPPHVFERVWQDYDGRRQRTADALGGHLDALREAEARLAERDAELQRALGERRDALAEVELRAMVGEFEADEGERMRGEVEQAIAALERDIASVGGELGDVRGLVAQVRGPEAAGDGARPDDEAPATDQTAEPSPEPAMASAPAGQPAQGVGASSADAAAGRFGAGEVEEQRFAPAADALMVGEGRARETPTGGFAAQGLAQAARGVPTARPEETPVGAAAQKTLRCQECGAMNYPTEWYCERCGGELAAL